MGEASVGKVLLSRFVRRSAGVNSSFFWRVLLFSQPRRAGGIGCGAAFKSRQ